MSDDSKDFIEQVEADLQPYRKCHTKSCQKEGKPHKERFWQYDPVLGSESLEVLYCDQCHKMLVDKRRGYLDGV